MTEEPSSRRRSLATAAAALLLVGLPFGVMLMLSATQSAFADRGEVGLVRAASATVDLTAGRVGSTIAFEDLVPGETVHFGLFVRNDGDLPLRYTVLVLSSDGELAARLHTELHLTDRACDLSSFEAGVDLDAPDRLGAADPMRLFGDPTPGPDPGDRLVRVDRSEVLCFSVTLPLDASNDLQGRSTNQTYVFDAEQAT